jgi:hypothetical protein
MVDPVEKDRVERIGFGIPIGTKERIQAHSSGKYVQYGCKSDGTNLVDYFTR